jgi:hypothetical protein
MLFHPATGLLTLSTPRFPFGPRLQSHTPTVAAALTHVRVVLPLFEGAIVTALLATEGDRLAFGL